MILYRLATSRYGRDLSGRGAELAGGRWNSKGTRIVYSSESRTLCTVEIAVHTPLGNIPNDYVLITLKIPDDTVVLEVSPGKSPDDWRSFPHSGETQKIGDSFIRDNEFLVLKVPSAVVRGDFNYLINPSHPDVKEVRIIGLEEFSFDERMFPGAQDP